MPINERLMNVCSEAVLECRDKKSFDFLSSFKQRQTFAEKEGNQELADFMRLLWGVFSMYFQFTKDSPYGPLMSGPRGRTMLPEDLTEKELSALEETLSVSDDPRFVARICDVLWIRKRNHLYAQRAVSAYLQSVDDDNDECWVPRSEWLKRATQIAMQLGIGSKERGTVKNKLMELFEKDRINCFNVGQDYWPASILDILIENKLIDDWEDIGDKCVDISKGFSISPGCDAPRKYYKLAVECYKNAKKTDKEKDARIAIAKHWEDEANSFKTPDGCDGFNLAHRIEKAIHAYREAGEKEKAEELTHELKEANKMALSQMKVIKTPSMDAAPLIKIADDGIGNKKGVEALEAFASLLRPFSYEHEKESAEKMLREHPLQGIFDTQIMAEEGNVVAKVPGIMDNHEESLKVQIVRGYNLGQSLSANTTLRRGIELIIKSGEEWRNGIKQLISNSHFVPQSRINLYERVLISGFEGDLLLFSHLIVPQIENSIRTIFGMNRLKITSVLSYGIQQEKDLNQLLTDINAEKIFGKDLLWEMRSLLVEKAGPNFRNRLCHGLMSFEDASGSSAVFLLWLTIYLIFGFKKK
ncbi:MAG: DUF4209 domain-containing protein [Candidatus Omnitrophica bacterium]|nr:DUF4209 domain-containing protein [Candidatus Omnitrophota bacterium]MBU2043803.1 DUF4209 domain-containing protein [Candidatus Omnitrophota bacterium]MBU2219334.1 DUF4209 domain-containing protein [Patescibacteria group bacterium]